MECELLRSPMISYRSLLYNTTVLYDTKLHKCSHYRILNIDRFDSLMLFIIKHFVASRSSSPKAPL